MKIIVLEHEPYQKRKNEHYFIDEFLENGFEIEYWGLHKIIPYLKNVKYGYEGHENFVVYFDSVSDFFLKLNLQNLSNTILIVELWYTNETKNIFEFIYKKSFKWVRINYYLNPTQGLDATISTSEMLKWSMKEGNLLLKLKKLVKRKFLPSKYNVPDVLYHTGARTDYLLASRNYISLDYYDVTTYESVKNEKILNFKYIVFLDIMLVDHPDIGRSGNGTVLDKKEYYLRLNKIFEFVEKELAMPIVIASHPKANYISEFEGRLVIKDKTGQLVTSSEMVLTHGSLSVSYALLAGKKIGYIDIKDLFTKNMFLRNIQESLYHSTKSLDAILIDENLKPTMLHKEANTKIYDKFLADFFRKKNDIVGDNFTIVKESFVKIHNEF